MRPRRRQASVSKRAFPGARNRIEFATCGFNRPAARRCYLFTVIRNVVLVKLKPERDPAEIADIQDDFRRLNCPGTLSYTIGSDLGLRDGNWGFAIVADFTDAEAYRNYDRDHAHNAARARLAPHAEQIARAQFEVPGHP
jgi:hypothetical protein